MHHVDLLLVNPSHRARMYGSLASSFAGIEPPLWTALIASVVRQQGFSVQILDADAEGWGVEETAARIITLQPKLVGMSAIGSNPSASSTPKMTAAGQVLRAIVGKLPESKTILYGIHPSALPERTLREEAVDFICRGEGFVLFPELLRALQSNRLPQEISIPGLWYQHDGQVVANGWGQIVEHLDDLPFAAWDLLPMDKYRAHNWHCLGHLHERSAYAVVYTSLGCPFHCSYCNIHALYGDKPRIRFRSPQNVAAEIDLLVQKYGVKHIKFLDELFVINAKRVEELCHLLIQRSYQLNIWAYARVDTVTEPLLRTMKQAGINRLCYGIEAGNKNVRDGVVKGQFGQEKIQTAIDLTHAAGIAALGNFIFGLPDDTPETMQETLKMAKSLDLDYINFHTTMAYPGSQLYDDAVAQGIPLPATWDGYAQFSTETFPLPTRTVSSAEVLRFRDQAFEEFFRDPAYLDRINKKFGPEAVAHIQQMLAHKIQRKFA